MKIIFVVLIFLFPTSAFGMEFVKTEWRGHEVLSASGPIIHGDADNFATALDLIEPASHGVPIVLLESPGGSVSEALTMSKHLDAKRAHMVIPNNAKCASACASILFVGGAYRTVEPFGLFGQHSCSSGGIQNQACNERISEHAFENGVSYGSVAAFTTFVPPEEILWFTRSEVDCWGISRYPFTQRSDFSKSEPCFFANLQGRKPKAQTAWRIDFIEDGYAAFLRPISDDDRELSLRVWCDETEVGRLYVSIDIAGPASTISEAIVMAQLDADPVNLISASYTVEQVDKIFSRLNIIIPKSHVLNFLTKADDIKIKLKTTPQFDPIWVNTKLAGSRQALIFAANNCINQ